MGDWKYQAPKLSIIKTEHHQGGESRSVPLFPELRQYLSESFEQAEEGAEFVITRYRGGKANLRTQFQRIIRKAGLKPWPKLFQNLLSTREAELAESYPLHVVCSWIGNSQPVAAKHYLQVTDEHFDSASEGGSKTSEKALQKPVQQAPEMGGTAPHSAAPWEQNSRENDTSSDLLTCLVGDEGDEHPPQNPKKTASDDQGVAESGALGAQLASIDSDLTEIVNAWDSLPNAVRAGILAMVRTTSGQALLP